VVHVVCHLVTSASVDSVGKATCSFEAEGRLYRQAGEQQRDSD